MQAVFRGRGRVGLVSPMKIAKKSGKFLMIGHFFFIKI
jgi:hypothetical protein